MKLRKLEALCKMNRAAGVALEDAVDGDIILEPAPFALNMLGKCVQPLLVDPGIYPGGVLFLDTGLLAPLADVTEMRELYLRQVPGHKPHIAAKSGLLLVGLVWPMLDVPGIISEGLTDLGERCRQLGSVK